MAEWPEDLFEFAFVPDRDGRLKELADLAEGEDWGYQHTQTEYAHPILFNFLRYTYRRLVEEQKIIVSDDGQYSCFNTGLVSAIQEPVFASFETNRREEAQPWFFKGWFRRGQWELNRFAELPDIAQYFDDPNCLVFDTRKELRVNVEHIIETNRERIPETYRTFDSYTLQNLLQGTIESAKQRVRRSYKTAIPQYYKGQVQLLLPLCFSNPQKADLALVVERHQTFYRASTCLTLDMAYNNARQLARPDRDWLQP